MTERNDNAFDDDDEFPFEDFEDETTEEEVTRVNRPNARPGNRNFWLAMGILAAVFLIVVIVLAILAFLVIPQNRQARLEEAALINAHNTATSLAATNLALTQEEDSRATLTPTPTVTLEPSFTPVIVLSTDTPEPSPTGGEIGGPVDDAGRTATVGALLTQAASTGTPQDDFAKTATVAAVFTQAASISVPVDDPGRTATVAALLTQAAGGGTPVVSVTPGGPTPTALPNSGLVDDVGLPGLFGAALALIAVIFLVRRLRLSGNG